MILRILFLMIFMGSIQAHADIRRTVENVATVDTLGVMVSTMAVPTTTTVFSKTVSLVNHSFESVGVMYKATSTGVIGISIQAERSFDKPSTEGSANTNFVVWNVPATTTDSAWHMATLDTVNMPYVRFKITGTGSNDAATTVQIKVEKQ